MRCRCKRTRLSQNGFWLVLHVTIIPLTPHRVEGLSLILLLDSCSQQTHCSTARTPLDGGLSPSLICFAGRCTLLFLSLSPAPVGARIFCRPLRPVSDPH